MKRVYLLLILIVTLLAASCSEGDSVSDTPPLPSESVVPQSLEPSAEVSDEPESERVPVLVQEHKGHNIKIEYPKIELDSDSASLINDYFVQMKERYEAAMSNGEMEGNTFNLYNWETYNAASIVSFLFLSSSTNVSDESSSEPIYEVVDMRYFAITVDAESGFRITLDDAFTVPRNEYLPRLVADLDAENVEKMLEFENFYLESYGIVIFFPPNTLTDDEWQFHTVQFADLSDILADWVVYDKE